MYQSSIPLEWRNSSELNTSLSRQNFPLKNLNKQFLWCNKILLTIFQFIRTFYMNEICYFVIFFPTIYWILYTNYQLIMKMFMVLSSIGSYYYHYSLAKFLINVSMRCAFSSYPMVKGLAWVDLRENALLCSKITFMCIYPELVKYFAKDDHCKLLASVLFLAKIYSFYLNDLVLWYHGLYV